MTESARWTALWTVRNRLTALYASLFLASGTALLAILYGLIQGVPKVFELSGPEAGKLDYDLMAAKAGEAKHLLEQVAAAQRAATLHQFLLDSAIALAVMTAACACLGGFVAGHTLRPLRVMAARAQRISEQNLHERLAIGGPQDELKGLADTFDGLLARLESAFDAQRQFVANASHELRTPLTLQRAMVEVALGDPQATAAVLRHTCERVVAAVEQNERLIDGLLTLARSQRGLDHHEPFPLDEITRDVLLARQASIESANLTVDTTLQPSVVSGDPRLAQRLIANLVDNAVQHNASGGWIRIETRITDGTVRLRVANSGPVIGADEIGRLLQPFQRRVPGRARHSDGLGLGLSVVQAIAAAHTAELAATPLPAGGLDVQVDFPVRFS